MYNNMFGVVKDQSKHKKKNKSIFYKILKGNCTIPH